MPTAKISSLKQLEKTCVQLTKAFKIPQLILLEGDLATGKSQSVYFMCKSLGFDEGEFSSPSFSLINVYTKKQSNLKKPKTKTPVYHIDLFRLKKLTELEDIDFWDIFYSPAIVFIEWPEMVKNKLPPLWNKLFIKLFFSKDSANQRTISYHFQYKKKSL